MGSAPPPPAAAHRARPGRRAPAATPRPPAPLHRARRRDLPESVPWVPAAAGTGSCPPALAPSAGGRVRGGGTFEELQSAPSKGQKAPVCGGGKALSAINRNKNASEATSTSSKCRERKWEWRKGPEKWPEQKKKKKLVWFGFVSWLWVFFFFPSWFRFFVVLVFFLPNTDNSNHPA